MLFLIVFDQTYTICGPICFIFENFCYFGVHFRCCGVLLEYLGTHRVKSPHQQPPKVVFDRFYGSLVAPLWAPIFILLNTLGVTSVPLPLPGRHPVNTLSFCAVLDVPGIPKYLFRTVITI